MIIYSISEPKYIILLSMMFSERGKYVGDAEIILNIVYFLFFHQSSALTIQSILPAEHTTEVGGHITWVTLTL